MILCVSFVAAVGVHVFKGYKNEKEQKNLKDDAHSIEVSFTPRESELVLRMEKYYSKEKERKLEESLVKVINRMSEKKQLTPNPSR